jgi:hypothetical protein
LYIGLQLWKLYLMLFNHNVNNCFLNAHIISKLNSASLTT